MSPKKPKVGSATLAKAAGKRQPKAILQPLGNDRKLIFSFQYTDRSFEGSWYWPRADSEDAHEILNFLCDASRLTWGEIMSQTTGGRNRHKKHHMQSTETLCADAQNRIAALHLDEIFDEVFRFRLSGEKRLWGFRVEDVFYVLWWDPHHKVYPTEPS